MNLRVGHEQAHALQAYQTLAHVVSQALGGKPGATSPPPSDAIQNAAQARASFSSIFGQQAVKNAA